MLLGVGPVESGITFFVNEKVRKINLLKQKQNPSNVKLTFYTFCYSCYFIDLSNKNNRNFTLNFFDLGRSRSLDCDIHYSSILGVPIFLWGMLFFFLS